MAAATHSSSARLGEVIARTAPCAQRAARPAATAGAYRRLYQIMSRRCAAVRRQRGASTGLASAIADGRITPHSPLLLSPHIHAAAVPAHTQP